MKAALCALLFLAVVGYTFAMECYTCSYSTLLSTLGDKNCGDPFTATGISKVTCDGKCTKTSSKQDGNTLSVTRGCSSVCIQTNCEEAAGIQVCPLDCCEGNLCNGAGPVTFGLVAMAALVMGAWAFSQQ